MCFYLFFISVAYTELKIDTEINEKYANMPDKIKISNTGSSHGYRGFNYYDVEDINCFSFAMTSQSIVYDYLLVDFYINNLSEDAVLFIPVSYFTFWNDELENNNFSNKNKRYESILDKDHIRYASKKDEIIEKYFSALLLSDEYMKEIFISKKNTKNDEQELSIEEIGMRRSAYHLNLIYDDQDTLKEINKTNIDSLKKLISICKENDVTPIMITTPFLEYYNCGFPEEVYQKFYEQIELIAIEQNVEYWDYSHHELFTQNQELFRDTDHLNEEGSLLFTDILISRLRNEGYLISE